MSRGRVVWLLAQLLLVPVGAQYNYSAAAFELEDELRRREFRESDGVLDIIGWVSRSYDACANGLGFGCRNASMGQHGQSSHAALQQLQSLRSNSDKEPGGSKAFISCVLFWVVCFGTVASMLAGYRHCENERSRRRMDHWLNRCRDSNGKIVADAEAVKCRTASSKVEETPVGCELSQATLDSCVTQKITLDFGSCCEWKIRVPPTLLETVDLKASTVGGFMGRAYLGQNSQHSEDSSLPNELRPISEMVHIEACGPLAQQSFSEPIELIIPICRCHVGVPGTEDDHPDLWRTAAADSRAWERVPGGYVGKDGFFHVSIKHLGVAVVCQHRCVGCRAPHQVQLTSLLQAAHPEKVRQWPARMGKGAQRSDCTTKIHVYTVCRPCCTNTAVHHCWQ
eukprot:gnl/MRDRNA2_/MRDRNA2_76950_c0_seq1.p1 gnl/MRDRNA2_/MRDRNA2_76950_c0~~gnl/MRDRNA2_/MRDRNA2_76950_c0_seq1.p1  ORF type:complete len:396 (-),score=55.60 gnl/MRDRNA2_/MRDRNA2_76950_c0_seq1:505-1692(-)